MKDYELKPCPYCGGDAELHQTHHQGSAWFAWCANDECPVKPMTNDYETCVEAIAVWNHRAERTCKLERHGSLANYPEMVCWSCSECHFGWHHSVNDKQFSYCPNCGAKVVGE